MPLELTPSQLAALERLVAAGFSIVAFPLYANYVGVRRADCATLLAPRAGDGMKILGKPCLLIAGNLTVRVAREGREWFVWKKERLEATPERLAELARFSADLEKLLLPRV